MPDFIKVRETIEYELLVDPDGAGDPVDYRDSTDATGHVESVHKEIVGRRHEVSYLFDCDLIEEVYKLWADGKVVYENRSHDRVVLEWGRLNDVEIKWSEKHENMHDTFMSYEDLDDPDRTWEIFSGKRENK